MTSSVNPVYICLQAFHWYSSLHLFISDSRRTRNTWFCVGNDF